ncbi:MAG: inositol monophosphatase family protein [Pseudomonadota bacterium]
MGAPKEELENYRTFAQRLTEAARGRTLAHFRKQATVFNKAGVLFDPVTDADREAERAQRDMIRSVYPEHGVLGEEFGERVEEGPWRWVLDPVDGTRAFVCGIPSWTTLIALEYDSHSVLGIIDQPFTDEQWTACFGETVYMRGGSHFSCKTSDTTEISKARISTTDPRPSGYFNEREAEVFESIAVDARLARFSLDAYAYGLLACGELDVVLETTLQRHDWAALVPVIEGAGGVATNWNGEPVGKDDRGEILAAATPELHSEVLERLRRV